MNTPKELILYEGIYWPDIVGQFRDQFPNPPATLAQEIDTLHDYLVSLGFFRMNRGEDKGLRFVGTFHYTLCKQTFRVCVLPKYLKGSDADSSVLPPILQAIQKANQLYDYADEAEFREALRNRDEKAVNPHRLALWLVQDYNTNGIFYIKEKRHSTQEKGRINWLRTISRQMPLIDGEDVFYGTPIYTAITRNDQMILSQIHRCAVREALDYLSAFDGQTDTIPPDCDGTMLGKLEQYAAVVRKYQRQVFANREIYLLRALEAWCTRRSRYYKLPVGTVFFDKVWEDALRVVFGNVSKDFSFGTPEYRLGQSGKFQLDNDEIPDILHLFVENNAPRFLLLDAKYYLGRKATGIKNNSFGRILKDGYQWIDGMPGYKDIAKQVDYRRTLEHRYRLTEGVNAFLLPWHDVEDLPLEPPSEQDPLWFRYMGYATKGSIDPETDEVCTLFEQLGCPLNLTDTSSDQINPAADQVVLLAQIKPGWLWTEYLHSAKNPQPALELWSLLKQHEQEISKQLKQETANNHP